MPTVKNMVTDCLPLVSYRRPNVCCKRSSERDAVLLKKIDDLAKCVQSVERKLDDLSIVKSLLLQIIGQNSANGNVNLPRLLQCSRLNGSDSPFNTNSAHESDSTNLANNEIAAVRLKEEPVSEEEAERASVVKTLISSNSTSDKRSIVISENLDSFNASPRLHVEKIKLKLPGNDPNHNSAYSLCNESSPSHSISLESANDATREPQNTLAIARRFVPPPCPPLVVIKDYRPKLIMEDEKPLLYNMYTIFGSQPCTQYFECEWKKIGPFVSHYRISNNIAVLHQKTQSAKVKSIPNFQLLMYKDSLTSKDCSVEATCSKTLVFDEDDCNPNSDMEISCEVSVSEMNVDSTSNVNASNISIKNSHEDSLAAVAESAETQKCPWWVLKYSSVVEQMKSKTYIDDFLSRYFDVSKFKPSKLGGTKRFIPERFAGPVRARRKNYTKEEEALMLKMADQTSIEDIAKFFDTTATGVSYKLRQMRNDANCATHPT